MEKTFQRIKNYNVAVKEVDNKVIFLRQLESESRQGGTVAGKQLAESTASAGGMQLSFFQLDDPILCQIRDEILHLDVNNLTPLEALNKLNDIKRIVKWKWLPD